MDLVTMDNTLRETWNGWEWSHVPGASIRGYDLALSCKDRSIAEIWNLHLSQRTLAKGDRLLHYICYAKIVNNLPKTREEKIYVNKLCYERELQLLSKRKYLMNWSDSQRVQLLQIYKQQIDKLGEEEFFARFDEIREEAHRTIEGVESYEPHDNRPYPINCTDGKGIRQSHLAEGHIIRPNGDRGSAMCRVCAQAVIDEYREKLGEVWTFELGDFQPIKPIPYYVDPIHSSAATLGRLGGKVKSEAKTLAVRENGRKGGCPKKQSTVNIDLFD